MHTGLSQIFRFLGRKTLSRSTAFYAAWKISLSAVASLVFHFNRGRKATLRVLLKQVYFTGFEAVPIVSWIALMLGLIIVTQALNILPRFGGEGLIGEIMVWVVLREAGPVLASVVIIARSGTAIASELGSMKIGGEISSLEIMGIDPMHYLVMPRVIGTAVSVFILTFYFDAISILGGYLLAGFGKSMTFSAYTASVFEAMGFLELVVSLLKSVLFGFIIGSVCTYHGLMVEKSITQIPQETTKAVIGSLRIIFFVNGVITFIFFI